MSTATAALTPVHIPISTPITCERGHVVAVVARDLPLGHELAVEDFVWRNATHPQAGDYFPACSVCSAPAHRETRVGVQLHTPGGWL